VGDGIHPVWAPFFFEDPEEPSRVWLFYCTGPPHSSGGSCYSRLSTDGGATFVANRSVFLPFDLWGGVTKTAMDPVRVSPDGRRWLLVFNSLKTGSGGGSSSSANRAGPHTLTSRDPGLAATGVLSSTDRGATWQLLPGIITDITNVTHFQVLTWALIPRQPVSP